MNLNRKTTQTGFSLVELMIAITLGLLILSGLTAIFVNNSRTRGEIEKANRQIENGRYAMQLLTDDLRLAGYLAEFDPSSMTSPISLPDPCATAVSALQSNLMVHVQGYDNATDGTKPSCVTDLKQGTDILVIRRASTCETGSTDCEGVIAGTPYLQASLCGSGTELNYPIATPADYLNHYLKLETTTANLTLTKRNCTSVAAFHRFRTHIYFIANNNQSGDGIPTLKRAELGATGFTIAPLVEGIENLQIEYGIDTPTVDGAPDSYTATPADVNAWRAVVSAKIGVLARNTEITAGYSDTKTYTLLSTPPTTAAYDSYKRHVYQSMVRLNNPAGRRTP